MDVEKAIAQYGKYYRTALNDGGFSDIEKKMNAFKSRLREMYVSENFKKHNIYPTTDATYIYAGLPRHVNFIRYSDLSDGPACFDEVVRKV